MKQKSRASILKSNPYIDLKKQLIIRNVDSYVATKEGNFLSPRRSAEEKIQDCFALLRFHVLGVPSDKIPLESILKKTIALGKKYIKKLPEFWHNDMLVVMNAALLRDQKDIVVEFSDWFQSSQFQRSAKPELLAAVPILFQVANVCRHQSLMDLKKMFAFLSDWKITPDPTLQNAISALVEKNPEDVYAHVTKSATRASIRINSLLRNGSNLNCFDEQLLSHALIWNCAEFNGICLPELPPHLHPFMITRDSLGLCKALEQPGVPFSRRFECGSSKYWSVSLDGVLLTVVFGKIGGTGQSKAKSFPTTELARKECDKLVSEKTKKGYVESK